MRIEGTDRERPGPPDYRHIRVEEIDGVLVVRFIDLERLVEVGGPSRELYRELHELAFANHGRHVALDLQCQYIGNSISSELMLCHLVRLYREVKQSQGTLKLCNLHPSFIDHIRAIRLDRMFTICESLDDALAGRVADPG
jgi:anti-anti-sigma regulatory factor